MTQAGIEPQWHGGRRVTDAATMGIVLQEISRLNLQLVNQLFDLGGAAVGLMPQRHPVVHGAIKDAELGLVGQPERVDADRIHRYGSRGLIPVIPPLSLSTTTEGQILNTNADDIALAIAAALDATKLVFGSSIPGVLRDPNDPSSRIASLTPSRVRELAAEGVITGGMIPKLESCLGALDQGVDKIHIFTPVSPMRCCWRFSPKTASVPK